MGTIETQILANDRNYLLVKQNGRTFFLAPDGAALGEFVDGRFQQLPRFLPKFGGVFYVIDNFEWERIRMFEQALKTPREAA